MLLIGPRSLCRTLRKRFASSHPFDERYPVPSWSSSSHVNSTDAYERLHAESLQEPHKFWAKVARDTLTWHSDFSKTSEGSLEHGDMRWFVNGQLNAAVNCVERHVTSGLGDKTAILWEGDAQGDERRWSYAELNREVCRVANVLRSRGVRRGDTVAIYMPMVPETAAAMLACARIGAVHSVVFAGFSAEAVRDRVLNADARVVLTADEGLRGGRVVPLKRTVDEALLGCANVHSVVVLKRTGNAVPWHPTRDVWYHEATAAERPYCPAAIMDAEDPLFVLYTSGSTGQPKGLVHTTGGYLTQAAYSHRLIFDLRDDDVYACMADVGWITGHTYIVYGPLANGATTLMFESLPTFPDASRYWELVERHRITQLYTAPTAIRTLMKFGDEPVRRYDRSSLRVLGTVGEPINPEAWRWYNEVVGERRCAIVDTYWQTETGAAIFTPLPGATPTKPGSAGRPFFGVDYDVLEPESGEPAQPDPETGRRSGVLALRSSWPGQARTVLGDHSRFVDTYLSTYKGRYFTGDGCVVDADNYLWITGRVDDVITKAGHRLGTAEIEGALTQHGACSESAVVAVPDDVRGQAIVAFCMLRSTMPGDFEPREVLAELRQEVRKHIGGIAVPDLIILTPALPKTRSGKIMRRVLRKIACNEHDQLGDLSTLADPECVDELIALFNKYSDMKK
jgi:acetyl-CoA synthetase